jgi:hypothetical protein
MREFGPRPTLGELQRNPGYGYGASAASIMRRSLARLPSSCGDRMLQATNCGPAPAATSCGRKGATIQHPGCDVKKRHGNLGRFERDGSACSAFSTCE